MTAKVKYLFLIEFPGKQYEVTIIEAEPFSEMMEIGKMLGTSLGKIIFYKELNAQK